MTINCLGNLIDLNVPKVMGILNITPDSFYDGGHHTGEQAILDHTGRMIEAGAAFIDLGAYSSRPGATDIPEEEEMERIVPVTRLLLKHFPGLLLSIDTFRSGVARACLDLGAAIINDISAGKLDRAMMATVAEYRVPYVMMHMRGTPRNMQHQTSYSDLLTDILYYFSERLALARSLGISDCILDPGFGFAKTAEQSYELLANSSVFEVFGLPILVGLSRKSMIGRKLNTSPADALNGTTALHMIALRHGARILRVHDVREAVECILLAEELRKYASWPSPLPPGAQMPAG